MREVIRCDEIIFRSEYGIKEFRPLSVCEICRQSERDFGTAIILPIFGGIAVQKGDIEFLKERYDTFMDGIFDVGSANDSQSSKGDGLQIVFLYRGKQLFFHRINSFRVQKLDSCFACTSRQ